MAIAVTSASATMSFFMRHLHVADYRPWLLQSQTRPTTRCFASLARWFARTGREIILLDVCIMRRFAYFIPWLTPLVAGQPCCAATAVRLALTVPLDAIAARRLDVSKSTQAGGSRVPSRTVTGAKEPFSLFRVSHTDTGQPKVRQPFQTPVFL